MFMRKAGALVTVVIALMAEISALLIKSPLSRSAPSIAEMSLGRSSY